MRAHEGDTIVVQGRHVGEVSRTGRVTEVLSGAGAEHYRVQWETGSETIFFPEADCTVIEDEDRDPPTAATPSVRSSSIADPAVPNVVAGNGRHAPTRPPDHMIVPDRAGDPGHIDVWFDHVDNRTESRVTIQLHGFEVTGFGEAKRNPHDPEQPIVGEELAAARALCDLAHQLLDLATYQIEKREGHQVTLFL